MTREYQFTTGPETSDQPATGTPSDDADLVNKGYADGRYMQGQRAVADITALKAIAIADRADGNLINILSLNVLYIFDQGSAATGDDDFVVEPDAGSGRWLKATNTAGDQTAQFDAITPQTTKGDIIARNSSNSVRLAVGANDTFLKANSATATGWEWAVPASASAATSDSAGIVTTFVPTIKSSIHTVSSADYTVLDTDGYSHILMSTGATDRTVTLPTASDNEGRVITIKKTDSGTGKVTIDGEGAETIDGETTVEFVFQYDYLTLVCNGSTWFIVDGVESARLDVSSTGSFNSSQPTIRATRIGTLITLTIPPLAHSSSSNPSTGSGFIPTRLRTAATNQRNLMFNNGLTAVVMAATRSDGTFELFYADWTGAALSQTTSQVSGSITYQVG